jgi:hypothetical protein
MAPLLARTQGASSPSSAGWAWSPRPGSWPLWAPPTGGRTGRRCGGRLGWTPPAASPDHRRPPRDQPGGSAWGRRAILDLAAAVCQQPGPWRDQLRTRTSKQHKPAKVALAATANAIGRTLFALMASGADFDPGVQAKRAAARKAGGRAA